MEILKIGAECRGYSEQKLESLFVPDILCSERKLSVFSECFFGLSAVSLYVIDSASNTVE